MVGGAVGVFGKEFISAPRGIAVDGTNGRMLVSSGAHCIVVF